MANNYLITGYWGEPHVTPENDRGIHAGILGAGRFVLPVGEQFKAEYIGNNTVRMYDGKLIDNGAAAGIPAGEYVDLQIANAGQGMNRNDLIVFQYAKDASTNIESGTFIIVQGEETSGTASDPALTQADLLSDTATLDQMPLWRIPVSGPTISAPVKVANIVQLNITQLGTPIATKANLNNIRTPGTYYVPTYDVAQTVSNLPWKGGTSIIDVRQLDAESIMQIVYGSLKGEIFTRYWNESEADWSPWKSTQVTVNGRTADPSTGDIAITVSDINGAARVTTGTTIPNGSDLDTYTTPGSYAISSGTNAASMSNIPYAGANCKLEVLSLGYASGMMQVLTFGDLVCHQYMRRYYNSAWGEWRRVVTDNMLSYADGTLTITTT